MGLILICATIPSHGAAGERSAEVDANDMVVHREVFTPLGWDEDNPFPPALCWQRCHGVREVPGPIVPWAWEGGFLVMEVLVMFGVGHRTLSFRRAKSKLDFAVFPC